MAVTCVAEVPSVLATFLDKTAGRMCFKNKIKEIFDPKLGERNPPKKNLIKRSQIRNVISHKSSKNLMMPRSMEYLATLSPSIPGKY